METGDIYRMITKKNVEGERSVRFKLPYFMYLYYQDSQIIRDIEERISEVFQTISNNEGTIIFESEDKNIINFCHNWVSGICDPFSGMQTYLGFTDILRSNKDVHTGFVFSGEPFSGGIIYEVLPSSIRVDTATIKYKEIRKEKPEFIPGG
jgi:hypothetical protein